MRRQAVGTPNAVRKSRMKTGAESQSNDQNPNVFQPPNCPESISHTISHPTITQPGNELQSKQDRRLFTDDSLSNAFEPSQQHTQTELPSQISQNSMMGAIKKRGAEFFRAQVTSFSERNRQIDSTHPTSSVLVPLDQQITQAGSSLNTPRYSMMDLMNMFGVEPSEEFLRAQNISVSEQTPQVFSNVTTSTITSGVIPEQPDEQLISQRLEESDHENDEYFDAVDDEPLVGDSINDPTEKEPTDVMWLLEENFENKEKLEEYLKKEKCWAVSKTIFQEGGLKRYYRCNHVKKNAKPQCSQAIYTVSESAPNDTTIQLFRNNMEHDHSNNEYQSFKVSDKVKELIIELYETFKLPRSILYQLNRKLATNVPTKRQVEAIIENHKLQKYGKPTTTMREILAFVEVNNQIPEELDKAFIVSFQRSPPEANEKWFRMFVSTKRLLQFSVNAKIMNADGTFKVTAENWPLIVIGTTDKAQRFHLIGLMLCRNEAEEDYKFAFDAIKKGCSEVLHREIKPQFLVADAAPAIRNGFIQSFGDPEKVIMCFFHVMHNVNLATFKNKANKDPVKEDLRKMQALTEEKFFDIASKLFIKKWISKESSFLKTFSVSFFRQNKNWFEGAALRIAKNNNGLESTNGKIKIHQTFWKKNPISSFKNRLLEIVEERSLDYLHGNAIFTHEVPLPEKELAKGIEYGESGKQFYEIKQHDGSAKYYVFSGPNDRFEITKKDVESYRSRDWSRIKSFDDFIKSVNDIYEINYPAEKEKFKDSTCTCPQFSKIFICKHIIALAQKFNVLPKQNINLDDEPIGANKRRGRPKNVKVGGFNLDE